MAFSTKNLKNAKPKIKIHGELNKATILRDLLGEEFNKIHVNNQQLKLNFKNTCGAPEKKNVKLCNETTPIFQEFNVTKQIKGSFGKNVTMKKGVYLVIEHAEAHVIDVNSGKKELKKIRKKMHLLST